MLRAFYIDCNSFFASCEQQEHPELRGRPVAVVPMLADNTSVIAACYMAKKYGIKTGTRVGDAKQMCPGLVLVEAGHSSYVKYHHKVIEAVESCIPVENVCSIDEIACELMGSQTQIENAIKLAEKVKRAIRDQVGECITVSIGISKNYLLAKIAADMQKPNGLTIVRGEDLPHKLYSLKLQDIPGIGRQMNERILRKGIRTIEQLLACDEHMMRAIWGGIVGARYHNLLKGEWFDYAASEPPKSIGHSHVLPPKERHRLGALNVAYKLLSKAAIRLRKQNMMVKRISLAVRYMNEARLYEEMQFQETQDTGFLLRCIEQMYQRAPLERPVKVSITLYDLISDQEHQMSFFNDDRRNVLFKTVDKINAKHGRDTVYAGSLHGQRERAPTRIAFSRIPGLDEVD